MSATPAPAQKKRKADDDEKSDLVANVTVSELITFLKRLPSDTLVSSLNLSTTFLSKGLLFEDGKVNQVDSYALSSSQIPVILLNLSTFPEKSTVASVTHIAIKIAVMEAALETAAMFLRCDEKLAELARTLCKALRESAGIIQDDCSLYSGPKTLTVSNVAISRYETLDGDKVLSVGKRSADMYHRDDDGAWISMAVGCMGQALYIHPRDNSVHQSHLGKHHIFYDARKVTSIPSTWSEFCPGLPFNLLRSVALSLDDLEKLL